jgi:cyclopropane fatty-acyl-phospholipid synthase-like methyltransferase
MPFTLDENPIRRLLHNPEKILGPYVKPGMTVMDVGCGMGFCSIAMAKMVGEDGKGRECRPRPPRPFLPTWPNGRTDS